jgi:hypothetical protein
MEELRSNSYTTYQVTFWSVLFQKLLTYMENGLENDQRTNDEQGGKHKTEDGSERKG